MNTTPPPNLGFEIRWHAPSLQYWLYVDAGHDQDGSPLTMATPATPYQVSLWLDGHFARLSEIIRGQGVPLGQRKPSKWRRFLRWLKREGRIHGQ
jgi:hypothetical protein